MKNWLFPNALNKIKLPCHAGIHNDTLTGKTIFVSILIINKTKQLKIFIFNELLRIVCYNHTTMSLVTLCQTQTSLSAVYFLLYINVKNSFDIYLLITFLFISY